jgi:hypothetical protein
VCTDDDCEAPDGWISEMAALLEACPDAAIAFCAVLALPHDRSAGYVPAFHVAKERMLTSLGDARRGIGLGAGMALRRGVILSLGGFDESFGPGARFGSGDDWDLSLRVLLRGWHVYQTARTAIHHFGFRAFAEGRRHAHRDWFAIGAVCAKPIRAGHWSGLRLIVAWFGGDAVRPMLGDLLRFRRPRGFTRVSAFVQGFVRGLARPVDREKLIFR